MTDIEKQIAARRKEALKKRFYNLGQDIVKKLGENDAYQDGSIRIKRDHYSQEYTGGEDNIEIFFNGTSVYKGCGNDYVGANTESDIVRYVPGDWEINFNEIADKVKPVSADKKDELRKNWGINLDN